MTALIHCLLTWFGNYTSRQPVAAFRPQSQPVFHWTIVNEIARNGLLSVKLKQVQAMPPLRQLQVTRKAGSLSAPSQGFSLCFVVVSRRLHPGQLGLKLLDADV